MSRRGNMNFGTVLKRSNCLNAKPESMKIDSEKRFEIAKEQLELCKQNGRLNFTTENLIKSYIEIKKFIKYIIIRNISTYERVILTIKLVRNYKFL